MKKQGPVLAVGLMVFLLLAAVLFRLLPISAEPPAAAEESTAEVDDAPTSYAVAAKQVARDDQQTVLLDHISERDTELIDRQAAYHQRLEKLSALIVVSEEQLTQLQEEESVLQKRIDQLLLVQTEHTTNALLPR